MGLKRISVDASKHVFALHGVDQWGRPVLRRELRRAQVEEQHARQTAKSAA